jgi:tRNA(Ser,Leu) C12 N-acetylase TAN1
MIATDLNNPSRTVSVEQTGELVHITVVSPDVLAILTLSRVEWDGLVAGVA